MIYKISFEKDNPNAIRIEKDGRLHYMIACPKIKFGCDIINFNEKLEPGYHYDFDGLILITTPCYRELYYKGEMIAKTKRI